MSGGESPPISGGQLLQRRLQQRAAEKQKSQAQVAAGPVPLSYAQERFWFQEQLHPGTAMFNRAHAVRLHGHLNVEALRWSLEQIQRRHAILRTVFRQTEEGVVQLIHDHSRLHIPLTDLRHLVASEREATLTAQLQTAASRPYDIGRDPLLRAELWLLAADEHVLLLGTHHIIADGWSDQVLWRELNAHYRARLHGASPELPPLPLQYADFARLEKSQDARRQMDRSIAYWRRQLAGLQRLELPLDGRRSTSPGGQPGILQVNIPALLAEQLRELSHAAESTLYMTLLAAFQVLLAQYCRADDIAVGTATSGRSQSETEAMIGMFVNTLVMRADLSADPTFLRLLEQTRQTALQAYAHQRLPFEKLVQELRPERTIYRNPLFDVFFQLTGFDRGALQLEGLSVERLPELSTGADIDLDLTLRDTGEEVTGKIAFDPDLLDESRVSAIFNHYLTLLQAAVANPGQSVFNLPLLAPAERRRVLVHWNETAAPLPEDLPLHRLVEQQAARTPDAPAIVTADQRTLTYAELNGLANRLARYLRDQGLVPGRTVGLALDRSPELMVSLLAVLKTGAAYLPLDPTYPPDRLAYIFEDADPSMVLFSQAPSANLTAIGAGSSELVDLREVRALIEAYPDGDPGASAALSDTAYIIYTSGSTGRPKGVRISRRALLNFALAARDFMQLRPGDRVWQFATINFDTAVEEIYPAWISGAAVVLRDAQIPLVSRLNELIASQNLTVLDLPTAYWQEWVAYLEEQRGGPPPALRLVMVGGEKVEDSFWQRWQSLPGSAAVQLLNTYGATELTAISTIYRAGDGRRAGEVPIGRPIANVQAYVLNRALQPLPPGVQGELYIGGAGLADGYVHDPQLTAARFVANPLNDEIPAAAPMIYRTGDIASYDLDGRLYYHGRADLQIKLRGFRVEPGEIEAQLRTHEAVQHAVVTLHESENGDRRLVGYVVPAPEEEIDAAALRTYLAALLPAYLVPAQIMLLPELPLNPHGKIDRRALPSPEPASAAETAVSVSPRNASEEALAALWREVLGIEQVDIHTSFFDTGGHSLLGVRLFALIESRLGVRLPLSLLFQAPTIVQMAAALEAERGETVEEVLVPIQTAGSRPPLFAPHGVYGDNLAFNRVAKHLDPEQPLYGFQAVGLLPQIAPDVSIEAMAARYIEAMRRVQPSGPYHLVAYCFGGKIAYEMACQLEAMGERVALLVIIEGSAPPDYHRSVPIYDARRVRAMSQALPTWLGGYEELGGWREVGRRILRPRNGRRGAAPRSMARIIVDEETDDLADIVAERPPIHYEMRTHHKALNRQYRPKPYGGRIVMIRAKAVRMGRMLWKPFDPERGWGQLASGGVDIHYVGGNHFTVMQGQNAAGVARALTAALQESSAKTT